MAVELTKVSSVELRDIGLDERWLQDRILEDPSLLGLGELEVLAREHRLPFGGRMDFLMQDAEGEIHYEIEMMLGTLDESHIIRAIEYWDLERQRRPDFDHRAVIVAEKITKRFFNVLRLLNRSVPMIAVQLSAFQLRDGSVVLHPVTVLDVSEEASDPDTADQVERTDRAFWEKKSTPVSLGVVDEIVTALEARSLRPRLTYNRKHIAMGTTGHNFCWFRPRKANGTCRIRLRVAAEARDSIQSGLEVQGIDATSARADRIAVTIKGDEFRKHADILVDALASAEEASRA